VSGRPGAPVAGRAGGSGRVRESGVALAFLAPALAGLGVFVVFPLVQAVYLATRGSDILGNPLGLVGVPAPAWTTGASWPFVLVAWITIWMVSGFNPARARRRPRRRRPGRGRGRPHRRRLGCPPVPQRRPADDLPERLLRGRHEGTQPGLLLAGITITLSPPPCSSSPASASWSAASPRAPSSRRTRWHGSGPGGASRRSPSAPPSRAHGLLVGGLAVRRVERRQHGGARRGRAERPERGRHHLLARHDRRQRPTR
jgi:hypothetical protein